MSVNNITDRINKNLDTLSKGQKKVARFILENPTYISMHSAAEVGKCAGTSETTVIRFCYAIGLNGYAQLQKEMTMYVFEHNTNSTLSNYVSSKTSLFQEEQFVQKMMGQITNQMTNVAQHIDLKQFKSVTKSLHEAERIYLIGAGASMFAVRWLDFTLNTLRPNVKLVNREESTLIRTLQEVNTKSVVIVVSLHRYAKEAIELAKVFRERGAHIIAITDTKVSPIHEHADEVFVLQQVELSTLDLMPALIAFTNTLVAGMIVHDTAYYDEQREKFDEFQNSFLADRWS